MWKWLLISMVVIVVMGAGAFLWMMKGPDVSKYEFLKNPRLVAKMDVPVLEVRFEVPAEKLSAVFGILMRTYLKLPKVPKGPGMPAPVTRYENKLDFNMEPEKRAQAFSNMIWKGAAAIPLPAGVTSLPAVKSEPGLTPALATWQYGEVAEILHIGPYEQEPATIHKLYQFIENQGYEIAGLHEEEYLRGPGMHFTKPANYYTILRYQVKKKPQPPAAK